MSILSFYYRYRAVVRSFVNRRAIDQDMRTEMDAHLAQAAERYVARGMSLAEARDAARREFGNVAVLQEEGRDARSSRWLETTIADVRFALRQIARRPLASATIVGVLGLGIGVHAGLFTFYRALNVRPPAGVEARDELVRLRGKQQDAKGGPWGPREFSYPEFMEIAARTDLFAKTTAWARNTVVLDFGDPKLNTDADAHFVTGNYWETVGSRMALGRTLPLPARADQDQGEMVAVIGNAMWRDLYGESPDVIGKTLKVNDAVVRIVGVAAPQFSGLGGPGSFRTIWMPLSARATVLQTSRQALVDRDSLLLTAAALLAPGVDIARASAAVQVISNQAVARMTPDPERSTRTADVAALNGSTSLPEDTEMFFIATLLGTLALLILVVACTNVSAIVVGAGVSRRQEIAIRLSLGASRWRLVRQLVTESCVLALVGGMAGLALYWAITVYVSRVVPEAAIQPDLATAIFTLFFALGTGILFGLSPALHATRASVGEVLKGGSSAGGASGRTKLQSKFVVAQMTVTQPLLVAVSIMLAMIAREEGVFKNEETTRHVVRVQFDYDERPVDVMRRLDAAMQNLLNLPGVTAVSPEPRSAMPANYLPIADARGNLLVERALPVKIDMTRPGYFSLIDVPIVRGRDVALADTSERDLPVVIGSDYAHELWGNADPIGRRFRQVRGDKELDRAAVVVGVYDATRGTTRGQGRRVFAATSLPWHWAYNVKTSGPGAALVGQIRDEIRKGIPQVPVLSVVTLEDKYSAERALNRKAQAGISVAGALVLLLASVGLYGVVGLAVLQRRREIGIRIALGARPAAVVAMLFRQGLRLGLTGLVVGLPLTVAAVTALKSMMDGKTDGGGLAFSPLVAGPAIAIIVLIVTSIATWIPARRAAVVDPTLALRAE